MFVDNVEITIKAGSGGSGLASFRREKFLPFGGPDGGDGGRGGDVYFQADGNIEDLSIFKHKLVYKARNGGVGGRNKKHGFNAEALVIKVPVGTAIYVKEPDKDMLVLDLQKDGKKMLAAKGGKGGKGNVHFATATRKAPETFQPGETGEEYKVLLKIILPIDVGIIGFSNIGKSSLLAAVSAARPKIAEYPFTTTEPVLGVVDDGVKKYTWAEIPSMTAGSHEGKGPGNKYLHQASRAEVMIYLLEAFSQDVKKDLLQLRREVALFNTAITEKKAVVVINKIDMIENEIALEEIRWAMQNMEYDVYFISAKEKKGLKDLICGVHNLVTERKLQTAGESKHEVVYRPKPVDKGD
ncbi:MAG: GTPase ObgE [Dehalococcoidia bacterium]|nr:GTPase ObgE [Dehalococcoidia bacterium]